MSLHVSSEKTPAEQSSALLRVDPLAPHWNNSLADFPDATIFHTSEWARVLIDSYGYTPYYFAGQQAGRPIRLCLFEIDSWLTGKRAVSVPFSDEAPLLGNLTSSELHQVLRDIATSAQQEHWKTIEVRGAPEDWDANISNRFYTHDLDVSAGREKLFENFHDSVRRALRKAERSALQVEIRQDESAVREYFDLHCLTRKKHGVPPQPLRFFKNIHRHIIAHGLGFTALAKLGQQTVAGAIFLKFGTKALYKFGASNSKFDSFRPSNLIMWKAIEHLANSGAKTLSFGRTDLHQEGLRRYKLGWGATEKTLSYVKYDAEHQTFLNSKANRASHSLARFLPVFLLKRVGAALYRHVG